jgi:tetratricopeptide (TPR) repeat protein
VCPRTCRTRTHPASAQARHEASAALTEAVALVQEAEAAGWPASDDLADYLSLLSSCQSSLDRDEEALAAAEKVVRLEAQRRLADPVGDPTRLARALKELSWRLGALNRYRSAASAVGEATTLYRQLAAEGMVSARHDLANSLNLLSYYAGRADRWPAAVTAAREEVALRRQLPARQGTSDAVDFAYALKNLAELLWWEGHRSDEAVQAAEEAVIRYRALANASLLDPTEMWGFAMVIGLVKAQMMAAGRYRQALAAVHEQVAVYRYLVAVRPDRHRRDLADVLDGLADVLITTGDLRQAVAARAEADSIRAWA